MQPSFIITSAPHKPRATSAVYLMSGGLRREARTSELSMCVTNGKLLYLLNVMTTMGSLREALELFGDFLYRFVLYSP